MNKYEITNVELEIMRVIWDNGSVTMNELTDMLNKNKSTTKTHIYRLLKKRIIKVDKNRTPYRYAYAIKREDFIRYKTEDIINNFFDGNKKDLIYMIEKNIK